MRRPHAECHVHPLMCAIYTSERCYLGYRSRTKKLLCPLIGQYDPEDPQSLERPAIEAGIMLAKRLDAHLEALALIEPPAVKRSSWPFWLPGSATAQLCDLIDDANARRRRNASAMFESIISGLDPAPVRSASPGPGYSVNYSETIGEITTVIGPAGRVSDITILCSPDTTWIDPYTPLINACLTTTGRPVLIVPRKTKSVGERIAVAWDGSEVAARALSVSMPILRAADVITIIMAHEKGKPAARTEGILEYLEWHGLSATSKILPNKGPNTEKRILEAALEIQADLIVIGSRLHSRLHTAVFGSLTEKALDRIVIAALLG